MIRSAEGNCAVLTLPNGEPWLSQTFNKLFVRAFYDRFICDQLNNFETSDSVFGKHLIMGTPGIGKSSFALYALSAALKLNKTVIYRHYLTLEFSYIFCPGSKGRVIQISREEYFTLLMNPAVVYIVDGVIPEAARAFTVYVSSPDYARTYQWSKQDNTRVSFFPPWTVLELQMLVDSCYSSRLSIQDIQARFDVVGGCPRLIVNEDEWKDRDFLLKKGVPRALQQFKTLEIKPAYFYVTSQRLMHIFVNLSTFKISHLGFASDYVEDLLLTALFVQDRAAVSRFINAAQGEPTLAVTAGKIFKYGVGEVLATFGDEVARPLRVSTETELLLPFPKNSKIRKAARISEICVSDDPVVWKMPTGNAAVDFILTRGDQCYFLQVTA